MDEHSSSFSRNYLRKFYVYIRVNFQKETTRNRIYLHDELRVFGGGKKKLSNLCIYVISEGDETSLTWWYPHDFLTQRAFTLLWRAYGRALTLLLFFTGVAKVHFYESTRNMYVSLVGRMFPSHLFYSRVRRIWKHIFLIVLIVTDIQ